MGWGRWRRPHLGQPLVIPDMLVEQFQDLIVPLTKHLLDFPVPLVEQRQDLLLPLL